MAPLKPAKSLSVLRWLLLLPIPILWCFAHERGWLNFLENKSVDWRFQLRGELESPLKIIYVDVDSLSLSEIGGWPWSREYFARLSAALVNEARVKAVGIDFVFSEAGMSESVDRRKHVEGNVQFGKFLYKSPPVVLAASYAGAQFVDILGAVSVRQLPLVATDPRPLEQIEPPELPTFELSFDPKQRKVYNPPFVGLIDTLDGGTRWVPTWVPTSYRRNYYHMAVELARLYWGLPVGSIRVSGNRLDFVKPDAAIRASIPLRARQLLEINWFSAWDSPQDIHIGFSQIYRYALALSSEDAEIRAAGKAYFAQDEFKDAVVLIGPVDPLLQDLAPTPFHDFPVPKVGVHGNLLKTIVSGKFLSRLPRAGDYAVILAFTLVVAALALASGPRALFAKIMAVLALGIYAVLAFRLFEHTHVIVPFTAPLGAALTTSFAGLIWQVVEEQKAKSRIKGMFGAYVAPQLVHRMIESGEDPQLGGHDAEITAYFSDIQGFSTFAEKLRSGPLVELMNEYLTACTDIVQEEGGTLDKYIGDAVVAMFGAPIAMPDHAFRACVATQRVHQKIAELRRKWQGEGDKWPEIVWKMQSRIGLNTGVCMIGNMGSRTRFNYTMMGDDVNLAARMESGAKKWGAYTLVTEATKSACQRHDATGRVVFRALGRIVVMGRSQAVPIHEIIGLSDSLPATARECVDIFEQGLARYYERDWDRALAHFRHSAQLEPNQPGRTPGVKNNPSLVYIDITEDFRRTPPPPAWDGVYEMKEK